mmetsp:Transcript_18269/g.59791  ORF Transcript_18269/g.59791 Transcript_18269/m.59791 type:complete len:242 (+) Transcript_18269:285-1010(+)
MMHAWLLCQTATAIFAVFCKPNNGRSRKSYSAGRLRRSMTRWSVRLSWQMLVTELAERTPWMTWTCVRWTSTPLWLSKTHRRRRNAPSLGRRRRRLMAVCRWLRARRCCRMTTCLLPALLRRAQRRLSRMLLAHLRQCLARVLQCKESRLMKGDKMGLLPSTRRRWLLEKSNKKQRREWLRPELMPVTARGCSCCKINLALPRQGLRTWTLSMEFGSAASRSMFLTLSARASRRRQARAPF